MFWNDEIWKLLGISFALTLIAHLKVHEEVFKHSCFERIYIEGCIWKFLWSFNGEVWNNRRFCPLLLKLWQKRLNLNIIIRTKGHFYYFECFVIKSSYHFKRNFWVSTSRFFLIWHHVKVPKALKGVHFLHLSMLIARKRAHGPPFFLMFSDSLFSGLHKKPCFERFQRGNKIFVERLGLP